MGSDTKTEILAAAANCFARFGYDKTTLDDIGRMVGVNKASLYYYFENKEAIFAEVIAEESQRYHEAIKQKVAAVSGCRRKIRTWIEEGFRYGRENSLHRLSTEALTQLRPRLRQLSLDTMRRGTEDLASILAECRKRGELVDCDVGRVARAIQHVIYAMKDRAYSRTRFERGAPADSSLPAAARTVPDILEVVSLILDGIVKPRKKGGLQ
jgi:AcrR family transcriptional regulator